jgi:hypothetical protein
MAIKQKIEKPTVKKPDGRKTNGGARANAGRKAFQPTERERQQVESMSGFGVPTDQIAALVRDGISCDTLYKYFERELVQGKAKANSKVGQTLFQKVMAGDTTAMIWWTKTQMRWSETHKVEHTGANGGPIETLTGEDLKKSLADRGINPDLFDK